MNYSIPEVDAFEFKAKMIANLLKKLSDEFKSEFINLNFLSSSLCIDESELSSLIYYLKRGEIIKTDSDCDNIGLTDYGELIYIDNHKAAYAPIIC